MNKYKAAPPTGWIDPDDTPPPLGTKIQILTEEWISILGAWYPEARGWAPLLAVDENFRARQRKKDEERNRDKYVDKRWQKAEGTK